MTYFKDELTKERENIERDKFVECSRTRLYQTTKHFYRELEDTNTEGLVVKLAAFDSLINSKSRLISRGHQTRGGSKEEIPKC